MAIFFKPFRHLFQGHHFGAQNAVFVKSGVEKIMLHDWKFSGGIPPQLRYLISVRKSYQQKRVKKFSVDDGTLLFVKGGKVIFTKKQLSPAEQ